MALSSVADERKMQRCFFYSTKCFVSLHKYSWLVIKIDSTLFSLVMHNTTVIFAFDKSTIALNPPQYWPCQSGPALCIFVLVIRFPRHLFTWLGPTLSLLSEREREICSASANDSLVFSISSLPDSLWADECLAVGISPRLPHSLWSYSTNPLVNVSCELWVVWVVWVAGKEYRGTREELGRENNEKEKSGVQLLKLNLERRTAQSGLLSVSVCVSMVNIATGTEVQVIVLVAVVM